MKFKNKKEEWEVKETMIALLTPLINHLDNRTKKACEITLRILAETNIESEDKLCIICANNGMFRDCELKHIMLSRKDVEMFCDHYCKFPDECDGDQEELDEICEECPLWKKCKEGES